MLLLWHGDKCVCLTQAFDLSFRSSVEVSNIMSCDASEFMDHLAKDRRVKFVQCTVRRHVLQAVAEDAEEDKRASDPLHFFRDGISWGLGLATLIRTQCMKCFRKESIDAHCAGFTPHKKIA